MTRKLLFTLIIVWSFLTVFGLPTPHQADLPEAEKYTIDLQGHRGARGLYPENTWPSIKSAIDHGMSTIELDFHLTKDKKFVAHHDARIHRKNCRLGKTIPRRGLSLSKLTLKKLKAYDCGYGDQRRFPRLTQVRDSRILTMGQIVDKVRAYQAAELDQKVLLNLEIKLYTRKLRKIRSAARALNKQIRKKHLVDTAKVQSFNHVFLNELRKLNKKVKLIALFGKGRHSHKSILRAARAMSADAINIHHSQVNEKLVRRAHTAGIKVVVWTINKPGLITRMLNRGVDGIVSDYPDLLYDTWSKWTVLNQKA